MPCITKIGQFIDIHSQLLDPGTLLCQALGNHCNFGKRQLVVCKGREISLPDPSIFLHSLVQVQSSNSAELLWLRSHCGATLRSRECLHSLTPGGVIQPLLVITGEAWPHVQGRCTSETGYQTTSVFSSLIGCRGHHQKPCLSLVLTLEKLPQLAGALNEASLHVSRGSWDQENLENYVNWVGYTWTFNGAGIEYYSNQKLTFIEDLPYTKLYVKFFSHMCCLISMLIFIC